MNNRGRYAPLSSFFFRIFEVNLEDTCLAVKYSSKLDIISRAYSYL